MPKNTSIDRKKNGETYCGPIKAKFVLFGGTRFRQYVRRSLNTEYKALYTQKTVKHDSASFSYNGVGQIHPITGIIDYPLDYQFRGLGSVVLVLEKRQKKTKGIRERVKEAKNRKQNDHLRKD